MNGLKMIIFTCENIINNFTLRLSFSSAREIPIKHYTFCNKDTELLPQYYCLIKSELRFYQLKVKATFSSTLTSD